MDEDGQSPHRPGMGTEEMSEASNTRSGATSETGRSCAGTLRELESDRAVNIRAGQVKNALAAVCAVMMRLTLAEGRHGTLQKELDEVKN